MPYCTAPEPGAAPGAGASDGPATVSQKGALAPEGETALLARAAVQGPPPSGARDSTSLRWGQGAGLDGAGRRPAGRLSPASRVASRAAATRRTCCVAAPATRLPSPAAAPRSRPPRRRLHLRPSHRLRPGD